MAYQQAFGLSLGTSQTGLAAQLRAQLVSTAGANVGAVVSTGFVEIGVGLYLWHYASIPDGHRGGAVFTRNDTSAVVAFVAINPEDAEDIALILAKTNLIGAGSVTVTSSVSSDGTSIALFGGDDYHNIEAREIEIVDTGGAWPDLTGATVTFYAENDNYGVAFTKAMTVVTPSGALKKIEIEFTAADTVTLRGQGGTAPGSTVASAYSIRAVLSTARTVTLVRGSISVTMVADGVNV